MKKILILLFTILLFTGCTKVKDPENQTSIENYETVEDVANKVGYDFDLSKLGDVEGVEYTTEINDGHQVVNVNFHYRNKLYYLYICNTLTPFETVNYKKEAFVQSGEFVYFENFDRLYLGWTEGGKSFVISGDQSDDTRRYFNSIATDLKLETAKVETYEEALEHFLTIDYDTAKGIYEDENTKFTGILVVSRETCPYCQTLLPVLADVTIKNLYSVAYLDSTAAKEAENFDGFDFIVDEEGTPLASVPTLIVFKDGVPVAHHIGVCEDYEKGNCLSDAQYDEVFSALDSFEAILNA